MKVWVIYGENHLDDATLIDSVWKDEKDALKYKQDWENKRPIFNLHIKEFELK